MRPVPKTMSTRALAATVALGLGVALELLASPPAAAARPGGGQSYSGGSHSSGSSHSHSSGSSSYGTSGSHSPEDEGTALFLGMLVLLVIYGVSRAIKMSEQDQRFDSAPVTWTPPRRTLDEIRARDPDFSAVLFEDFVYALYARAQAARGDPKAMEGLAPYIASDTRSALLARAPAGVKIHGVVIGKMEVLDVTIDTMVRVVIVFAANYTAELPDGPKGYYVAERWSLTRALGVTSKPPAAVHSFNCPSCGGPYERSDDGRCSRCAQQVTGGRFDWWLAGVSLQSQEGRPPALTGDVEEQGTHFVTVRQADIETRHGEFAAQDRSVATSALERRVREIHAALNTAWTARDLRTIRPHVSDALYNYLSYWIDAYKAQGLRNVLVDVAISRMEVVKLTRDHHFDAISVRFWARGIDYTVRVADERPVSGNPKTPRAYSEYWTLIRGAGVRGSPRTSGACPNCGAPLDRINMAGNCEACGTHLTRGEFDWVLSKIEQDESYNG